MPSRRVYQTLSPVGSPSEQHQLNPAIDWDRMDYARACTGLDDIPRTLGYKGYKGYSPPHKPALLV